MDPGFGVSEPNGLQDPMESALEGTEVLRAPGVEAVEASTRSCNVIYDTTDANKIS